MPGGRLVVFFFAGSFVQQTDGCHVRACQDLEMLVGSGRRVVAYSYRNHMQWPWGEVEITAFKQRFPSVELVLDAWTPALAVGQKVKSLAAMVGGRLGHWAMRIRVPGASPGLDKVRKDPGLEAAVVSYSWGISHLNGWPAPRLIVDTHDLSSLERIQERQPGRLDAKTLLTLRREIFYLGLTNEIWSISYAEWWFLQAFLGPDRVRLVPPALKSWTGAAVAGAQEPRYDLVFVGSNNRWNAAAMTGFLQAYADWGLPLKIAIAGAVCDDPDLRRAASQAQGVELLGFVDDLDALYAGARASVCPVEGTGTKIKLIEALRAGRPVFAAPGAMSGLVPGYEACVFPMDREGVTGVLGDAKALAAAQAAAIAYSQAYDFDRIAADVAASLAPGR